MSDLLNALLRMREAALEGRFEGFSGLTAEIETLLSKADSLTKNDRIAVMESAKRNTAILAAALQGMRAARRRLSDLREASTGHRTYGPSGQRSSLGLGPTQLRQRV